jgi:hypothetical protein
MFTSSPSSNGIFMLTIAAASALCQIKVTITVVGFTTTFICHCKLQKGCTRLTAASDKGYQLLVHGRWFSQGTPPLKLAAMI